MTQEAREYIYTFMFEDGTEKTFHVHLDSSSLAFINTSDQTLPEWTNLEVNQCPNCPLDPEEHPTCPVAVNMYEIADLFREAFSYEDVHVTIETEERTYSKEATVQEALSSLFGIIMVTSGCPVLDQLRPLVRTHLPFSTIRESLYRTISMYMTAQYFRDKKGLSTDYSLEGLVNIFSEISKVNKAFCNRLAQHFTKDANVNAVVILNCFAEFASISIQQDLLDDMERTFGAYLGDENDSK